MRTRLEIMRDIQYSVVSISDKPNNTLLTTIAYNQQLIIEMLLDIRDEIKKVPGSA